MLRDRIEQLQQEYTDKYVVVDGDRPELARFRGLTGQVKTINMNGRALVRFDAGKNEARYDIELDFLKVVDRPAPAPPAAKPAAAKKAPPKKPAANAEPAKEPKPSPLELARKDKPAKADQQTSQPARSSQPSSPTRKETRREQPVAADEDPQKLSALERARMEKESREATDDGAADSARPNH